MPRASSDGPERDATTQQFVHLHTHSEYSLLDGLSRVRDLVVRAKDLGMPALAITDHGALYGAIDFYHAAKAAGIKPIVGVETYIARKSRFDRDARSEGHGRPFHLVLLVRNFTGYQNLVRLVTAAHLDGYYYRPRMDKELLRQHSDGLIALSACLQGEVARAIQDDGIDAATLVAKEHLDIFGEGNYYLELMDHGIDEQRAVNDGIREVKPVARQALARPLDGLGEATDMKANFMGHLNRIYGGGAAAPVGDLKGDYGFIVE